MALSHPPLNQNTGRHSPALTQNYPAHQLPYAHMQGQPGLQAGQLNPMQITTAYPHPYTAMPGPGRPPPQQMMNNAVPMSSQQAQALAQQQQQQRQILVQQQQMQAQAQAVQHAQAQPQRGVPPSPHHPSPSPHIAHQGFPGANGPGIQHFHGPQPPGVSQSPAPMRQPQPHMQQVRPATHPYQQPQHMQPGQPQPGLNGMAQNGAGGQHMQHQHSHGVEMNGQDAYAMARAGSGVQISQVAREADFQLKLYILDFLLKSNCQQAAQHFVAEAGLGDHRAALNVPEGLLRELWTTFWDAFSGGKGGTGPMNSQMYTETMNRLKGLRQQISIPVNFPGPQPGQYVMPNGQGQPQPITQQQVLHFRQQQAQAAAHAQANGQPQMMQQQMHQQQAQQNQQHAFLQQQARMNSAPGPSVSPVPRPPQPQNGQHMYAQQNLQPPGGTPHSHSPNQPSPHLVQHPHPVMQSPHQKAMRPPNGAQAQGQPGGQPGPMVRAMTPQQAMQAQGQPHPGYHPQGTIQSPVPMTPQQQQLMQQAMRVQGMIDPQAFQGMPGQPTPQGQPQPQPGPGQPGGPPGNGQPTHQQLMSIQQQHMHNAANQMYAGLGLGQINPQVMASSAQALGLQNRDVGTMSEDDRNRLIQQYRMAMQETQRRMLPGQNQHQMMAQQAAQQQAHAQAQQFQHQQNVQQNQQQAQQVLLAHAQAEAQSARMQQQQARMRANGTMPGFEHNQQVMQPEQGRNNSPPDRKRMRRNSGGASAPSPFIAATPGGTPHPHIQFGSNAGTPHQMNLQIGVGMPSGHDQGDGSRQVSQEARIAYEKQMHRDQLMRQNSLGSNGIHPNFQPHTPNMSNPDAPSPATTQPIGVGQSPRNVAGRAMQRAESKGAMLPPQSPAMLARSTTPKPGTAGKTPKAIKEEPPRDGTTPKSLHTSPNNNIISIPPANEGSASSTHGFTPSPPSGSTSNATPNPTATIVHPPADPAQSSVPSLSADSNSLSFNTDLATDGGLNLDSGDFDFSSLVNMGEGAFDFGQYLAELGDDGTDGGEVVVP